MMDRITRAGHRAGCALVIAFVLLPAMATAQQTGRGQQPPPDPPQRPTGAIFDGSRRPQRDILSLNTELYGGYDQELQGPPGTFESSLIRTGAFGGLDAGLTYNPTQNPTVDFNARAFTSLRYYSNPADFVPALSNADASASFGLGRRVTVQARGGIMYSPYYDFPAVEAIALPGVIAPVPPRARDVGVAPRQISTYDGAGDISYAMSQAVGIGASYGIRKTELIEDSRSAIDTIASARVNFQLNRLTSARIALVHREGEHEAAGILAQPVPVRVDDLEFRVDRDWIRSPTRQTYFTFTGGPSRMEQQGQHVLRAIFGAGVTHAFARSWDVRAMYRRGVTFLDGIPEPVLSNAGTLNLGGMLTSRLELSVGAAVTLGEVGFESLTASTYDTYIGSVRGVYGLSRSFGLYAEYVYQQHEYRDVATEFLPGQDRSGVRVGVTWYMPLMQESVARERPGVRRRNPATP
jgi:hypothetical protein